MILVAGATGVLGGDVCRRLREVGQSVRALVRRSANPTTLSSMREAGVELAWGDLKDEASIREACKGVDAVISTASSTLSRQPGDTIETVDLHGQLSLIRAAKEAGAGHFTFVSIPRNPVRESPLTLAKKRVEQELATSGVPYTILAANYFMEIWLSPALGFDYVNGKAVIFGDGRQLMSWISYKDVAEFAIRAADTAGAHNRILAVGGPEDLSPLDVVSLFEDIAERPFERQHVPEEALLAQLEAPGDPLTETFTKLQLEYVHGCLTNTAHALQLIPIEQRTVRDYALEVARGTAATV